MNLPEFLVDHPDGEIRFRGHRIGLYTIARQAEEGRTAEEIAEEYPTLSLEIIRKTLAFCAQNQSEIAEYVRKIRAEIERQAAAPPGPGVQRIRELLKEREN